MLAWLAHFIERRPRLHRAALAVWKVFPPRLAGFLKGLLTRNWIVGAVAVMIDDSVTPPQVLMVKHSYRREGVWGLPGGALEAIPGPVTDSPGVASGDDVIERALRREISEELGLEIKIIRLMRVDAVPFVKEEPGPYRLDFYFKCLPEQGFTALKQGLDRGSVHPRSPEISEIRMVPLTLLGGFDLYSSDTRFLKEVLPTIEPDLFQ